MRIISFDEIKKIYTDGACSGNPGKGGWAAVILDNNSNQSCISGKESNTTNNRMELMAPIMALKNKKKSEITVFTDSKYVKDGITDWIKKWKINNWKGSNKKPVKNKDLWIKLDNSCLKHKVTWKWVKAHAGNKYNNLADELAVSETK